MKIQFLFDTDPMELEVELLDNPAVKGWAQHFRSGFTGTANIQNPCEIWDHDPERLAQYLETCGRLLEDLRLWGYIYEGSVPETPGMITRGFTNHLHRFFTYYQDQVNRVIWGDKSVEESARKKQSISDLLQRVNDCVHAIERYLPPVPDVSDYDLDEIYISDESVYDDVHWWTMHSSHRQYHSDQHADVVFGSQILGKTILRSYLDGDDPNDWDTSGHYCNNCSLQILPNDSRQRIYQSDGFNQWLAYYGVDRSKVFFDFPVGRIVNRDNLDRLYQMLRQHNNLVTVRYFFK